MKQHFFLYKMMLLMFSVSCVKEKPAYLDLVGRAQGTTFNITYRDSLNRDFSHAVDSLFRLIDKSMSLWNTGSILSRINRNEPDVILDQHFIRVLNRSREISDATYGKFDVTIGPLVKAWGFSKQKYQFLPDSAMVDSLLPLIGMKKITHSNGVLQKSDPRMEIDFNAIAQGYTVDLVAVFLEKHGVENYLVEIGGELRTLGVNENGNPWMIGIDKPVEGETADRPLQTTIELSGKSLATSGSYRKFLVRDGKKYSHAIDPQTGRPIDHNLLSVSVIAEDCMSADAYATAFLVMGMDKALELAHILNLEIYCIYADGDGALRVKATPGFGH